MRCGALRHNARARNDQQKPTSVFGTMTTPCTEGVIHRWLAIHQSTRRNVPAAPLWEPKPRTFSSHFRNWHYSLAWCNQGSEGLSVLCFIRVRSVGCVAEFRRTGKCTSIYAYIFYLIYTLRLFLFCLHIHRAPILPYIHYFLPLFYYKVFTCNNSLTFLDTRIIVAWHSKGLRSHTCLQF
jgi:hypothetical protein